MVNSNFIHTLTAYHLDFSYRIRNNPLSKELEDKIKNKEKPDVNVIDILNELTQATNDRQFKMLADKGKIILFNKAEEIIETKPNVQRIFIIPSAGKTNMPIRMVNLLDKNEKDRFFDSNWASAYPHNIFIYKIKGEYYMVCHRNGGSGCKTILSYVFNKALMSKGIRMDANWMPPVKDDSTSNLSIEKVSLIYEEGKTGDIADEPGRRKKKEVIRELTLSMKAKEYRGIGDLMRRYRLKEVSKEETFNAIQKEVDDYQYNDATITVKIGRSRKTIGWDDFECLIDGFDITDKVNGLKGNEFTVKLKRCADDFITSLLEE